MILHSSAENKRGVGEGSLSVMEEVAMLPFTPVEQIILPTLLNGATVFAIGTPSTVKDQSMDTVKKLITWKQADTQKPVFTALRVAVACEGCIRLGRAEKCEHRAGARPHFHKKQVVDQLRNNILDYAHYLREVLGIEVGGSLRQPFFHATAVQNFLLDPDRLVDRVPGKLAGCRTVDSRHLFLKVKSGRNINLDDVIVVGVDTSQGGASGFAVVSVIRMSPSRLFGVNPGGPTNDAAEAILVVGFDQEVGADFACRNHIVFNHINAAVERFRIDTERRRNDPVLVVVVVERGPPVAADHLCREIVEKGPSMLTPNTIVMAYSTSIVGGGGGASAKNGNGEEFLYGFSPSQKTKQLMLESTSAFLNGGRIRCLREHATAFPEGGDESRQTFYNQMIQFQKETKPGKEAHQPVKYAYSGKFGGGQDDLVVAFAIAVQYSEVAGRNQNNLSLLCVGRSAFSANVHFPRRV